MSSTVRSCSLCFSSVSSVVLSASCSHCVKHVCWTSGLLHPSRVPAGRPARTVSVVSAPCAETKWCSQTRQGAKLSRCFVSQGEPGADNTVPGAKGDPGNAGLPVRNSSRRLCVDAQAMKQPTAGGWALGKLLDECNILNHFTLGSVQKLCWWFVPDGSECSVSVFNSV